MKLRNVSGFLAALVLANGLAAGGEDGVPRRNSDHTRVGSYLDDDGREQPAKTPEDWARRRRAILAGMQEAMGPLPDRGHLPPLDLKITSEVKADGFLRKTISFVAEKVGEAEDRIPAYLLLPAGGDPGERLPAILALHQTAPLGKGDATIASAADTGYGVELARRGYVVLCPDYPSFGDYAYNFKDAFRSGRYASGTMKGIFNHMRCIDFLQSHARVDGSRIGAIGHSLGGHNAMFLAAFDERVKAVVSSCGWTPFGDYYGGKLAGWTSDRYMPRLREVYGLDPGAVPFDFQEVVAALAPRPFFSCSPQHDSNFDVGGVRKAAAEARAIYELLGAPEALQVRTPDCGHEFPAGLREEAYAFLDGALKPGPRPEQPEVRPPGKADVPKIPDLKEQLPRTPPHEPGDATSTLKVLAGFRVEQVAAEPLVRSPVACDFDEDGRLYVCEMIDYPNHDPDAPLGRVSVLEDADGDGRFDRSTVLAAGLPWPTAVLCYDGGVFVGAAPDILYLKDNDGDGQADVKDVVFTGFGLDNVQGLLNSFRWGLDNRVQGATSSCGGKVRRPGREEKDALALNGRDFSFDPKALDLRAESGGAQHGMSFDDWGRKYVSSNSDHIQAVMYDDRAIARNPSLAAPGPRVSIAADGPAAKVFRISPVEPWRAVRTRLRVAGLVPGPIEGGGQPAGYFSGATGVTIYRGDAWPAEYRGQAFIGDVGSNLVHRKVIEPDGVGFLARRADEGVEFLASTDTWFRPAQFANAPDGSLLVLDAYREVIEHPASLPEEIKKHLDLTSGRDRGRIYRIVPEGFARRPQPKLGKASTDQLVAALEHRNGWHRDTAARLLYQRQDMAAAGPLREMAAGSKLPEARMHALYALSGIDCLTAEVILAALNDDDSRVREHAIRLAEGLAGRSPEVQAKLAGMVDDPDVRVRYRLAFALGAVEPARRAAALARLLRSDGSDRWMQLAVFSSLSEGAGSILTDLARDATFRARPEGRDALSRLAEQVVAGGRLEDLAEALRAIEDLQGSEGAAASAILEGLGRGASRSGVPLGERVVPGSRADLILRERLDSARRVAVDGARPEAERVEAVRALALGTLAGCRDAFEMTLTEHQPQAVQLASIAALDRFSDPQVGPLLVAAWPHLTPRLRAAATDAIFARPTRLAAFLDAIEAGKIPLSDLDAGRLRIAAGGEGREEARDRARKILAKVQLGRRKDVVEAYQGALARQGDKDKGKLLFRKTCNACHRLEGDGQEIGPNLAAMQARGPEAILVNVLDPNREVNPQYVEYAVSTRDGRTTSGLLAAETATSVTLRRAGAAPETVLRAEIEAMRSTGLSLMPEGLEKQLDPEGLADVIAYLMSLK